MALVAHKAKASAELWQVTLALTPQLQGDSSNGKSIERSKLPPLGNSAYFAKR